MTTVPDGLVAGLDVLQRALDYTCAALSTIDPGDVGRRTPCAEWSLADLLAHMEDALDAFAEAADGAVGLVSATPAPLEDRVRSLQAKASGLLAAWLGADSAVVRVGGHALPLDTVAGLAALEIAVHGWDVGASTGRGAPLPERLAAALLPIALRIALASDDRFAAPVPVDLDAPAGTHVLALLGRSGTP